MLVACVYVHAQCWYQLLVLEIRQVKEMELDKVRVPEQALAKVME